MKRTFACLLCCVAARGVGAQIEGPFELPVRFVKARFPQAFVADCSLSFGPKARTMTTIRVGRMTARVSNRIRATGTDNAGNPWAVEFESKHGGCSLWRADLDRDGQQDLIALTTDATSGGESVLTLLLIDNLGRPVPWQAVGHYDEGDQGIANLVDLDRDGRAELLFLHVEGIDRGRARVTSLSRYEIKNARLKRVDGRFATETFPARVPRGARVTEEPDLTTALDPNPPALTIASLVPARQGNCGVQIAIDQAGQPSTVDRIAAEAATEACYDKLILSDGRTLNLPAIVILENQDRREVALDATIRSVIEANMRRLPVEFTGQVCDGSCRPFMMWADKKQR